MTPSHGKSTHPFSPGSSNDAMRQGIGFLTVSIWRYPIGSSIMSQAKTPRLMNRKQRSQLELKESDKKSA